MFRMSEETKVIYHIDDEDTPYLGKLLSLPLMLRYPLDYKT